METIKSALAQDYGHTEIIVVDDGSPTDTAETISEFGSQVRLLVQENAGPGAARNYGARESRGEFIAFLDHDDLWAPRKISEQLAAFTRNPDCGLAYCYPVLMDERGVEIPNEPPAAFPSGNVFEDFIKRNRITTYSATMVRRSAFFAVGGIDDSLDLLTCDDYDLWLRLAAHFQVEFIAGPLVFYRIHPGNLLNNHQTNMDAHLYAMEKCRNLILENNDLARDFDYESAIAENENRLYRKFAMLFYYDYPKSNQGARNALWQGLKRSPRDFKFWVYYFLTFPPFVWGRKIKRSYAKRPAEKSAGTVSKSSQTTAQQ